MASHLIYLYFKEIFKWKRSILMNFIDFIILAIVLAVLGLITYHNFIKKDKDVCSKCAYRKDNCNCGKRK